MVSRWSQEGRMCWAVKTEPCQPRSSCWASSTLREAPGTMFSLGLSLNPRRACCCREPLHTPVGQIFSQRKDTRSHRWEGIPLKTVASRVRSWVLGADAFYRSNKLDTVHLVMYWQVSWSLDYLAQGEEAEAEAKLGSVTRSRSQIGTESS